MRLISSLFSLNLALAMAIQFEPTDEWKPVPDGVAIPGGLEIKMDINAGGRWARLRQNDDLKNQRGGSPLHSDKEAAGLDVKGAHDERGAVTTRKGAASGSHLTPGMLAELEDKAHDFDDGAEIMQMYGARLFKIYSDANHPDSESAGRILTVSLRNNGDSASMVPDAVPGLAGATKLHERSINILSALVSTPQGMDLVSRAEVLPRLRRDLAYSSEMSANLARNVARLLQNLAVSGGDDDGMCEWVDALTQAYFTTRNETLRDTAVQIVEHAGDFEGLKVHCRPQPGLLPPQKEAKRAAETSQKFANTKAQRNHFDEL